ncbi:hypothetical protein F4802DRAFT_596282 [Xylaria palmicola]|nr:hypothetical protein F4802DRAFT_596282 [Xylaria palmicola]
MPKKKSLAMMGRAERLEYLARAKERRRRRAACGTGATEQETQLALRLATRRPGGKKKYSWLDQGPETVAQTLGRERAVELGIRTGKLARELKIGEYCATANTESVNIKPKPFRDSGIGMATPESEDGSGYPGPVEAAAAFGTPSSRARGSLAGSGGGGGGGSYYPVTVQLDSDASDEGIQVTPVPVMQVPTSAEMGSPAERDAQRYIRSHAPSPPSLSSEWFGPD